MKYAIALILGVLGTGCGSATTSDSTNLNSSHYGTQLPQSAGSAGTNESASGGSNPTIDYNPRSALNYAAAISFCQNLSRALCTKTQYDVAYTQGKVANTISNPGYYWMEKAFVPAARNLFLATPNYTEMQFQDEEYTKKFYCCKVE